MVKISRQTVRTRKTNREILIALFIFFCVALVLVCSGVVNFYNTPVTSISPREDFHFIVEAGQQQFDIVPDDVLRIERTPSKKAVTGQDIEILKIYTTKGFIFAVPDDPFYEGARQLANAVDFDSKPIYIKGEDTANKVELPQVRQVSYAIGTPEKNHLIIFAVLGLQNLAMLGAGMGVLLLIFPLRVNKEQDAAPVVKRLEQPA